MSTKYCWSYADSEAIGDFDSRDDAVADFERSLVEEDYDLDIGSEVEVTTYESVPLYKYLASHSGFIGWKVAEVVSSFSEYFVGVDVDINSKIAQEDAEVLGLQVIEWFLDKVGEEKYGVERPVVHTFIVPDND